MPIPSPTVAVPSLQIGQLSYMGFTFGGIANGTTYALINLEGLGSPDILSGDVQRGQDQGEFAGLDLLPGRDITLQQVVSGTTGKQLAEARMSLGGVMTPTGATEYPLWVQTEVGLFVCSARPRRHHFPWDINAFLAKGVVASSQFHATDPRWYSSPTRIAQCGMGSPLGGLSFGGPGSGISFGGAGSGVTFGGGAEGGLALVANNGYFECRPLLVLTGPMVNPKISNLSIAGAPWIGVEITLNSGDSLIIDTDLQTVSYATAGSGVYVSRRNLLMAGSTWWNLPEETTSRILIRGSSSSVEAGTLAVQSADAYISL